MARINYSVYRKDRAKELQTLATILHSELKMDVFPLQNASTDCCSYGGSLWGYEMQKLVFRLTHFRHPIPRPLRDVTLELSLSVAGHCYLPDVIYDPFEEFQFNIFIAGSHVDSTKNERKVYCGWHLDKDIKTDNENKKIKRKGESDEGVQEFIHPLYHFHYGGDKIENLKLDLGASMILTSPRLAHPPMDAILGVDFVLTNYFNSADLEFRKERVYQNLLQRAQDAIWRPYAQAIAHIWQPAPVQCMCPNESLWPQVTINRSSANMIKHTSRS